MGDDTSAIIEDLKGFSKSINNFINNSTDLFTSISDIFPKIEKNIDNEIMEAQAVIDFFFNKTENIENYGLFQKINDFKNIIHRAVEDIHSITNNDTQFYNRVSDAITDVREVIKSMDGIRNISEELKVYAINSITFANRAGERGRGYHILAKEYIQISDRLSKKVDEVAYSSDRVLKTFNNFDSGIKVLHNFYIESFSEVSDNFSTSSSKLEEGFKNICTILKSIIDRVKTSKDPICNIMIDMQRQDIIQQQLTHVDESIKETLETLNTHKSLMTRVKSHGLSEKEKIELEDVYKLIHTICYLNIGQLDRIQKDINIFNTKTLSTFKKMKQTLDDIEEDKTIILDFFIGTNSGHSSIDELFDKPEKIIADMSRDQDKYINLKEGIIEIARTLDGQTGSFNKSFTSIVSSTDLINQMQVLTKVEIYRNSLDSNESGVKTSSLTVSDSFQVGVPQIISNFNNSLNRVVTYVNDFISEFNRQRPILNNIISELFGAKNIIDESKSIVREYLKSMLELTDELEEQVSLSLKLFNDLTVLENDVFSKVDILLEIIKRIEVDVKIINTNVDLKTWRIKDEVMAKLVDKYTVASERNTAMDIFEDLSIEDSNSSNITLF